MLHPSGGFPGIIGGDDNSIIANLIKLCLKGEGAVCVHCGNIQIGIRRQNLDYRPWQSGGAYQHGGRIGGCGNIGGKIQRNILLFPVQGNGQGVFPAVLAAHHDLERIFADGLHGGVVADLSAFGVHQVAVILAVDGHGAAFPHIEHDIAQGRADLLVRAVRRQKFNGGKRNVDVIVNLLQRGLLAGIGHDIRADRYAHGFLQIVLVIVVPDMIGNIKSGNPAGNNRRRAQFLQGDALAVRAGNGDGMGRQIVADGGRYRGRQLLRVFPVGQYRQKHGHTDKQDGCDAHDDAEGP